MRRTGSSYTGDLKSSNMVAVEGGKGRERLTSALQSKTWKQTSLTATITLTVVAVAVVVHMAGTAEVEDAIARAVAAAIVGAAAGSGVAILRSLREAEAKAVAAVAGAVVGSVPGGIAGIAASVLGSLVGAQSQIGLAVAGAMAGATTVTVARVQLQWAINKTWWATDKLKWVRDQLQWVRDKLKWVRDKLKWVTDKLQWVTDKPQWVTDKLQWVRDQLQWVADKLQWVADKIQWVADKLQWVAVLKGVKAVAQRLIELVEQASVIQLGSAAIAAALSGLVAAGAGGVALIAGLPGLFGGLLGGVIGLAAGATSQWRGQKQAARTTQGDSGIQGGLACSTSWGRKESGMTGKLNCTGTVTLTRLIRRRTGSSYPSDLKSSNMVAVEGEKGQESLTSALQSKTWKQTSLTATITLTVVAVAVVVHMAGTAEVEDAIARAVAAAIVGAAAGSGVAILRSLREAEAKAVAAVAGAVVGSVPGGIAGIAASVLGSLVGAQSQIGLAVAGAMAGATTVTVARVQLQWAINKTWWATDKLKWVRDKLQWVRDQIKWVRDKIKLVKDKLKWVTDKLQWLRNKLQWVTDILQWVRDKLKWVTDKLQWVRNKLKWVRDKLKWVRDKLQWVRNKLKWVRNKLQWVADKLQWVADKIQWVADKLQWVAFLKGVKSVAQRLIELVEHASVIQLGSAAIAAALSGLVAAGAGGVALIAGLPGLFGGLLGGVIGLVAGATSQWRGQKQATRTTDNSPQTNESPQTDNAQQQTSESPQTDNAPQTGESWTKEKMQTEHSSLMPGNIKKKLLENLGLAEHYNEKLTLQTVLQIDKTSITDVPVQSLSDLPWLFLKRLMLLQRTARSVKCSSSDGGEDSEWDDDQEAESDCPQSVNPLDVLTAVFLCSDSFLQQEIILKMSMCQFAVPLLLPNTDNSQITLMLWAVRDIVKKYIPHTLSDPSAFVEERIALSELPLVSFVRLGRCNISKSDILNKLLSNPQQYTDTFVHFNMDCGNISKKISDGLVEMAWYLPCGNKNIDVFPEPVAFANLRGDIQNFETQYTFLCEASTAVFVFFESQLLDSQLTSVPSQKSMPQLFFVGDSINESIKATVSKLNLNKNNFIFKAKQNDADFVDKIQSKLQDAIKNNNHKISVVRLAEIAQNLGILVDEDAEECQRAKASAHEITSKINDIVQFKKEDLPLQGEILMKLAKLEKEECRMKKVGDKSVEHYKNELLIRIKKLREEQYRTGMSATMSCFINAISTAERAYFLKWMRINLENHLHKVLPPLRELYKQKCQDICGNKTKLAELDKNISNSSLGVEHFIREMSQLYEAAVSLPEDALYRKQLEHLPKLCAQLLLDGFSLELVDGDSSNIPEKWITSVFSELNTLVEPKNKIMVVTVLGVQSSGKSTLLNTMFGVQFAVSSGRCTRGAFMQLIKVTEECKAELKLICDYIMIIDTEGLKSAELAQLDNSYEHDNELATLVVGLSDVTIVNIAMENSTEMKDILQIIVHAFLRMKEIGKKHKCLFVHQNVADVSAHDSNMRDRKFLLEQLDEMTQAAAKMENKLEFKKFTDLMNYDTETGDHYIPGLWHGNPPMAPVSIGYSESVYALKKHIMEIFRGYQPSTINEFIRWTKDLWTAVKFEKFIFSFRNSLVADAYIKLCTEYNRWEWTLRKQMHTWALEAETNILNYGKFENSEQCTIEDVQCNLLQEAEAKLSKGHNEIIDEIQSYYEQGEGHVELVESYRQDFINSAMFLKTELSNSITRKLDAALSRRNGMMKVEGIKKTYMDTMEKKVLNLLKDCREKKTHMSDSMLDEAFKKMWQETVRTLLYTGLQRQDIMTRVFHHLRKNLQPRGSSMAQSLDEVKDLHNQGHGNFVVHKGNFIFKFFNAQKIQRVEDMSDNLIRDCWEFVKTKRESKDDYDDTYIREILNMIDEKLKAHEDLKLKEDFELSLKLHICGFASREFQNIHNQFIQKNNPLTALENFQKTYHSDFIDLYRKRDQCQKKADEFMSNCLKPTLERYISEKLGMEMANKMIGENSAIFGSRTTFQISVLKNLLAESKFETYLHFIASYEKFVKKFIFDKVKKHFTAENRMIKLEEELVNKVISEITRAIEESEQDSKKNDIKGFIENICKKLENRLVFPKDAVDKISTLNNANQKKFTECLLCSVKDMDELIKESLQARDFQSKIKHLQTKPQDVLFKRVQGCGKQCPFCEAPCEAGGEAHAKHSVSIHRPQGLGCYRIYDSKKLVTDICTSSVHSDSRFKCCDTTDQWRKYKEYDQIYPDWQIKPDPSIEASAFWKYVMATFNEQFAEEYNAKPADIPPYWTDITKTQIEESLK